MDVKVDVTQDEINKAIARAIKSVAKAEFNRKIKNDYIKSDPLVMDAVKEAVKEMVHEKFNDPEFLNFLKKEAAEYVKLKTGKFIRAEL